jgi:hypothetical protein
MELPGKLSTYSRTKGRIFILGNIAYANWDSLGLKWHKHHLWNYTPGRFGDEREFIKKLKMDCLHGIKHGIYLPNAIVRIEQASSNYFHFLIDNYPDLLDMHDVARENDMQYDFMLIGDKKTYMNEILSLSGVNTLLVSCRNKGICVEDSLVEKVYNRKPSSKAKNFRIQHAARLLNLHISKNLQRDSSMPEKIFVERGSSASSSGCNLRNFYPQDEFKSYISSRGFVSIVLEKLTFIQQATLFANAKEIAAIHGAGLTNLFFAREEAKVYEFIHAKAYSDEAFCDYSKICDAVGVYNYKRIAVPGYLPCSEESNALSKGAHILSLPLLFNRSGSFWANEF